MTSIAPKTLADMILRIAQLPVPAPVTIKTQPSIRFTSFPIRDFHLDRAKAIMNDKPKPVPFSGMPGYSERGAPEDWDTAMGEVYGYRYWHLAVPPVLAGYVGNVPGYDRAEPDYRQGILYGANNQPWRDGRQEARCMSPRSIFSFTMDRQSLRHQPPETREACACGFWAYFNRDLRVGSVMGSNFAGAIPYLYYCGVSLPVFGVVKGTGRVIIGEKGFRSQYAQITGLCIPPVAVQQLSWWLTYPESRAVRWGIDSGIFEQNPLRKEKCSEAEKVTRIAQVEAILSAAYPSARLFTSQDLLTRYFPPDENYA